MKAALTVKNQGRLTRVPPGARLPAHEITPDRCDKPGLLVGRDSRHRPDTESAQRRKEGHRKVAPGPQAPAAHPEELSHQAMVEEQERRDREAEAERDRDDL